MKEISSNELDRWMAAYPGTLQSIYQAYKETIPGASNHSRFRQKLQKNHHIVNNNFETDPKYLAAYYLYADLVIISLLYVFPEHRGNNYGRTIIEQFQCEARNTDCILQVAVEANKTDTLGPYYTSMGFLTLDQVVHDANGIAFVDYFWAAHKISMEYLPEKDEIIINRIGETC